MKDRVKIPQTGPEGRRKVVAPTPEAPAEGAAGRVTIVVPTVDMLVSDAMAILHSQLSALMTKARKGEAFSDPEARQFAIYVKSLESLTRSELTFKELEALERLPDGDLLKALPEAMKALASANQPAPAPPPTEEKK